MTCTRSAPQLLAADILCERPGGRASWVCSLFLKFLVMKLHENRVL